MQDSFDDLKTRIAKTRRRWLVTGAAGFIGSHSAEALLALGQDVIAIDNFATGTEANVADFMGHLSDQHRASFELIKGDIQNPKDCELACANVEIVLHQAGRGSVPLSIEKPEISHNANVVGTFNLLRAAQQNDVKRFVYASSSSVYGDNPDLPKVEEKTGKPLSPYAATKQIVENLAQVFFQTYGLQTIGLRYFNVFGPRQDPNGAYAAVIPRWIQSLLKGEQCSVNGDGNFSRDFCYVENIVEANLRAALTPDSNAVGHVYNVGAGQRTTLNKLYSLLVQAIGGELPALKHAAPRQGDIPHSLASIAKIQASLGYKPRFDVRAGLAKTVPWYKARVK